MDFPDKHLLDVELPEQIRDDLNRAASILLRYVNFGTHLYKQCHEAKAFSVLTPLFLGRQIIEVTDAISILVRQGSVDPCFLLLRSQFEYACSLEFISEKDSERRARQYEVGVLHGRIKDCLKSDPSTEAGKQRLAQLKKDRPADADPVPPYDSTSDVKKYQDGLADTTLVAVETEWQRMVVEKKARRKQQGWPVSMEWYSLFGGPANIQGLAEYLGRVGTYEDIYRMLSTHAHGSDVYQSSNVSLPDGANAVKHIRHPINLVFVIQLAVLQTDRAYRCLINLFLNRDANTYNRWYIDNIRGDFERLRLLDLIHK